MTVPDYTVQGTWTQTADGRRQLLDGNGVAHTGGWLAVFNPNADLQKNQSAFDWFLFDEAGNVRTGWYTDAQGETYYLNPSLEGTPGAMAVGWNLIDGKYYYFSEYADGKRGHLLKGSTTPDGYRVDENGVWIQ